MKKVEVHYDYKHNETATPFGRSLGIRECFLGIWIDDKQNKITNRFGAIRAAINSAKRNCADIVKIHSITFKEVPA